MTFTKILAAALLASTAAGSAFAADLPSRKAPVVYAAPVPVMTWTGFYVGLNGGYAWSGSNAAAFAYTDTGAGGYGASAAAGNFPGLLTFGNRGGFAGGGQIGFNWQAGALVAGIEADIQARTGAAATSTFFSPGVGGFVAAGTAVSTNQTWFGTVRGRLGFTVTPSFLLYATGGLAYGDARLTHTTAFPVAPFAQTSTISTTRVGYAVGAGAEWMFAQNWSAKLEYMYTDLGRISSPPLVFTYGANISTAGASTRITNHLVRAGLNYHFNFGGPSAVVARY